jgi:hypothetical protein
MSKVKVSTGLVASEIFSCCVMAAFQALHMIFLLHVSVSYSALLINSSVILIGPIS